MRFSIKALFAVATALATYLGTITLAVRGSYLAFIPLALYVGLLGLTLYFDWPKPEEPP